MGHLVEEHVAVEPEDVRVHDLVVDAHRIHVPEPGPGIERGQERLGEPLGVRRRELGPLGLGEGPDAVELAVAHVPDVLLATLVEPPVGDQVTPPRRHP